MIRLVFLMAFCLAVQPLEATDAKRQIIFLDGTWSVQRGGTDLPAGAPQGKVPVPGLTDMATNVNGTGDYWWYQREFTLNTAPTAVALLKINKAMYGTVVYLNDQRIGEYLSSFSPSYHDLRPFLHFNGDNKLVIRVGERGTLPPTVLNMNESEKITFTPGIYDSVSLILDNNPHIETVQTNPKMDGTLEIKASFSNTSSANFQGPIQFTVKRVDTDGTVGQASVDVSIPASGTGEARATLTVRDCQFWTPEKPFLYTLTTETPGDQRVDRFGMRTFRFNSRTRMPELNGKPYALLGTNICIYRFFEDPARGSLPWNKEWVRALVRKFKTMHWNSMRLSLGPPPDFWYDIFDEEGFLVQDEAPIWYGNVKNKKSESERVPEKVTPQEIAAEETPCVYDRCNHPSIFLWDLANETASEKVKAAINILRPIDLQGRRWEDGTEGWNKPVAPQDPVELHIYPFWLPTAKLEDFNNPMKPRTTTNPAIVNEYGYLWLARDGSPTSLTYRNYEYLVGGGEYSRDFGTEADRRYIYATYLAADTEYLRASRQFSGIHEFSGLSYSRPNPQAPWHSGYTSDNFLEPVSALKFDPYFENYVRDAFAPVGICIERYTGSYPPGSQQTIPVSVYNDTAEPWKDDVRVMIVAGGASMTKKGAPSIVAPVSKSFEVPPGGKITQDFPISIPTETNDYTLVAEYGEGVDNVQCVRDFVVGKKPRWERDIGPNLAAKQPVKASSCKDPSLTSNFAPEMAVDGDPNTSWVSAPGDPAWIEVDLGKEQSIGMVRTGWPANYAKHIPSTLNHAKDYIIEISDDEANWRTVATVTDADGYHPNNKFAPVMGRYVRVTATKAANSSSGIAMTELEVYPPSGTP